MRQFQLTPEAILQSDIDLSIYNSILRIEDSLTIEIRKLFKVFNITFIRFYDTGVEVHISAEACSNCQVRANYRFLFHLTGKTLVCCHYEQMP